MGFCDGQAYTLIGFSHKGSFLLRGDVASDGV